MNNVTAHADLPAEPRLVPLIPAAVLADEQGMAAGQAPDGRFTREGDHDRLLKIVRILCFADPVRPEAVTMPEFNRAQEQIDDPGCPKAEQCRDSFPQWGWQRIKDVALSEQDPARVLGQASRSERLSVTAEEARRCLLLIYRQLNTRRIVARQAEVAQRERARTAGEAGWDRPYETPDPDEGFIMRAAEYEQVRMELAAGSRRRDSRPVIVLSVAQIERALNVRWRTALAVVGLPTAAWEAPDHPGGVPYEDALEGCLEGYGALPAGRHGLEAFAALYEFSLALLPPGINYMQAVERLQHRRASQGLWCPAGADTANSLVFEERNEHVAALSDAAPRSRRWTARLVEMALVDWLDWLYSPDGPADRKPSQNNLRAWTVGHGSRPSTGTVGNHGGLTARRKGAVARRAARDRGEVYHEPDWRLEELLASSQSPVLAAVIRHATDHDEFYIADLDWIGVTTIRYFCQTLTEIGVLFVAKVPGPVTGARNQYRLARPLTAVEQAAVDALPAPEPGDGESLQRRRKPEPKWSGILSDAYAAAQRLGTFTAPDLGQALGITRQRAFHRVRSLHALGALTRDGGSSRKHIYTAVDEAHTQQAA